MSEWTEHYCVAIHVLSVFSAARLRGLVLIWVYFRCFMEALLDV